MKDCSLNRPARGPFSPISALQSKSNERPIDYIYRCPSNPHLPSLLSTIRQERSHMASITNDDLIPNVPEYKDESGAPPNIWENNREWHGYKHGLYLYPCDEEEKDRLDIYHTIFSVARGNDSLGRKILHKVPIPSNARILDVGAGTGIWCMRMAERYPDAEVIGTDIVNIQPHFIHTNVRFKIPHDFESPWQLGDQLFDVIHLRMGCGSVSNWPALYERILAHLKPGGWLEQVEIDITPRYDSGNPSNRQLEEWFLYLNGATNRAGKPLAYPSNIGDLLSKAGFVRVEDQCMRLPLNEWPEEAHEWSVGRWYNLGFCEGLESLTLGPLSRAYEWPLENIHQLLNNVKPQVCSTRTRAFNELHVWTAQRPLRY